jgi:Icc-related predicted phosphoesterase
MTLMKTKVRLWILSDLHLELTRSWDLPSAANRPEFDVLVVAGDLVPKMERGSHGCANLCPIGTSSYIAGNHEA